MNVTRWRATCMNANGYLEKTENVWTQAVDWGVVSLSAQEWTSEKNTRTLVEVGCREEVTAFARACSQTCCTRTRVRWTCFVVQCHNFGQLACPCNKIVQGFYLTLVAISRRQPCRSPSSVRVTASTSWQLFAIYRDSEMKESLVVGFHNKDAHGTRESRRQVTQQI